MRKSALIIVLLILMTGQATFAVNNSDFQSKIEIISPALNSEGSVVLSNDLYISIRIKEEIDCLIEVVKIKDYDVDMSILDKVFLNTELTEEEKGQIYNANIARNYFNLKDQIANLQEDLIRQEMIDDGYGESASLIFEQQYAEIMEQYNFYEKAYRDIFRQIVLEPEPLTYEGILPYYERNVPIVEGGDYKMIFLSPTEEELMEIDFIIKSKETIAKEIIDNIPLRMIRMIDFY